mgnify:CR=1 FL=1
MDILITSDGPDTFERAVEYTLLFADDASLTLLYPYQSDRERKEKLADLEHLADKIRLQTACSVRIVMRPGYQDDTLLQDIQEQSYDLVVFGVHLQSRLNNLRPKHDARELARRISIPLLVVFPRWEKLERILIWTEGKEPDELALHLAGTMASQVGARCTVLHVMSQIPLRADAETEDLDRDAQSLMEHETREGRYLEEALATLERSGVPRDECQAVVRHGMTVNEIVKESQSGDFDLVVMGGVAVHAEKSWHELRELVQEDIADQVLATCKRPVLITRQPDEKVDWNEM